VEDVLVDNIGEREVPSLLLHHVGRKGMTKSGIFHPVAILEMEVAAVMVVWLVLVGCKLKTVLFGKLDGLLIRVESKKGVEDIGGDIFCCLFGPWESSIDGFQD
jgi:hypothetical protein